MDRARCTTDNTIYMAVDNSIAFNMRPDFATLKNCMVCPACNGRAIFRREGSDGREACFVGRPHAPGCRQASLVTAAAQPQVNTAAVTVARPQRRIIVDFGFGAQNPASCTGQTVRQATAGSLTNPQAQGGNPSQSVTLRLRRLLSELLGIDDFRHLTEIIHVPNRGDYTVADLFVNFEDVTDAHINAFHGYWGSIVSAEPDGTAYYFNSGRRFEDVSAQLDQRFIQDFYRDFNISEYRDIGRADEAFMLAFGELIVSSTGKKLVQISDPHYCTLRLHRS